MIRLILLAAILSTGACALPNRPDLEAQGHHYSQAHTQTITTFRCLTTKADDLTLMAAPHLIERLYIEGEGEVYLGTWWLFKVGTTRTDLYVSPSYAFESRLIYALKECAQ